MILSRTLDYLANPIVNIFSDDFDESQYWQPDWLKNDLQSAKTPNLSDLFLTEQLDAYENDTNIYCEFSDLEDIEGFGLIDSWHHYPYVFAPEGTEIDKKDNYAYVLTDIGASTYVHKNSIRVIERVIGYETNDESQPLPQLLPTASVEGQYSEQDMCELQHTAHIGSSERAS